MTRECIWSYGSVFHKPLLAASRDTAAGLPKKRVSWYVSSFDREAIQQLAELPPYDWCCPFALTCCCTSRRSHAHHAQRLPLPSPCHDAGQVGGYVEVYDGLTFSTVRNAGHMVPYTQAERAYYLFSHWIHGKVL